jgi:hypothetical protein
MKYCGSWNDSIELQCPTYLRMRQYIPITDLDNIAHNGLAREGGIFAGQTSGTQ